MAQFDVYKNPRSGSAYPLVVDVQSDVFGQLDSRVVVPLSPRERYTAPLLTRMIPIVVVEGRDYALVVPLLAAIARNTLGPVVTSLATRRFEIIAAIDLLIAGS
jgi:toxin CcdB